MQPNEENACDLIKAILTYATKHFLALLNRFWEHICSNVSSSRALTDGRGRGNHTATMPSVHNLAVFLIYRSGCIHNCWFFQRMFRYFDTQSTMQGEGWFIVMSPVLPPGCPANICWATGPLSASRNLFIHIRKHQPYHMYMYYSHDPV